MILYHYYILYLHIFFYKIFYLLHVDLSCKYWYFHLPCILQSEHQLYCHFNFCFYWLSFETHLQRNIWTNNNAGLNPSRDQDVKVLATEPSLKASERYEIIGSEYDRGWTQVSPLSKQPIDQESAWNPLIDRGRMKRARSKAVRS